MPPRRKDPKTGKEIRARYSKQDKAKALTLLAFNSDSDGPVQKTADQLEIPVSTLWEWAQGRWIDDQVRELIGIQKNRVAELYDEIAVMGALRQLEILHDDRRASGEKLRDFSVTSATATDKSRLLRGEATSITQTQTADVQSLARQLLADYLAQGKSRDEAAELAQIATEAAYPGVEYKPEWVN